MESSFVMSLESVYFFPLSLPLFKTSLFLTWIPKIASLQSPTISLVLFWCKLYPVTKVTFKKIKYNHVTLYLAFKNMPIILCLTLFSSCSLQPLFPLSLLAASAMAVMNSLSPLNCATNSNPALPFQCYPVYQGHSPLHPA